MIVSNFLMLGFYLYSVDSKESLMRSLILNFAVTLLVQKALLNIGITEKASRVLANITSLCLIANDSINNTLAIAIVGRITASFGLCMAEHLTFFFKKEQMDVDCDLDLTVML